MVEPQPQGMSRPLEFGVGQLEPVFPFFMEKWYFDCHAADGRFLLAYLAPLTLFGIRTVELAVWLFSASGPVFRRNVHFSGRQLRTSGDRTWAEWDHGRLTLDAHETTLHVAASDLTLDLRLQPMDSPWLPSGTGSLLRRGKRGLRWVVPVPRGRGQARGSWNGANFELEGLGYSDFVQLSVPPWQFPMRELLWGRAVGEDLLLVWNQIRFAKHARALDTSLALVKTPGMNAAVECSFVPTLLDWRDHPPTVDRYPGRSQLAIEGNAGEVGRAVLDQSRLLLGAFVTEVQQFRSPIDRAAYRWFTRNPVQYKLLSRAELAGGQAWAAHEWVRWGKR